MIKLTVEERLKIYTRYIGHGILLVDKRGLVHQQIGILTGVKKYGIQVRIDACNRWIPLYDNFEYYEIKLLLKPLSRLTDDIRNTANSLPIQNFITQYYIQLGFDMPVFIAPDHPANCKYVSELGLATYNIEETAIDRLVSA